MATTSTQTIELKSLNATDSSLALKAFVSEATSILQHRRPRDAAFTLEQGPDDTLPDPLSLNSSRISEKDITEVKRRKVQKFYRQQNEQIDHLLSPLNSDNNEDHEKQILKVKVNPPQLNSTGKTLKCCNDHVKGQDCRLWIRNGQCDLVCTTDRSCRVLGLTGNFRHDVGCIYGSPKFRCNDVDGASSGTSEPHKVPCSP